MEHYNQTNVDPISDNIGQIFDPNIVSISACNGNLERANIVSNIVLISILNIGPILVSNIGPILVSSIVLILEANALK